MGSGAIRLQFVAGAALSSRLIAWWGNGWHGYSHVDAVMADGTLIGARDDAIRPLLSDGSRGAPIDPGIQVRPPNYEKWIRRAVVTFSCDSLTAAAWETRQLKGCGAPYDPEAIIGLALGLPLHEDGHWICSAWQAAQCVLSSLFHPLKTAYSQITPDGLFNIACAVGGSARMYA